MALRDSLWQNFFRIKLFTMPFSYILNLFLLLVSSDASNTVANRRFRHICLVRQAKEANLTSNGEKKTSSSSINPSYKGKSISYRKRLHGPKW